MRLAGAVCQPALPRHLGATASGRSDRVPRLRDERLLPDGRGHRSADPAAAAVCERLVQRGHARATRPRHARQSGRGRRSRAGQPGPAAPVRHPLPRQLRAVAVAASGGHGRVPAPDGPVRRGRGQNLPAVLDAVHPTRTAFRYVGVLGSGCRGRARGGAAARWQVVARPPGRRPLGEGPGALVAKTTPIT